MTHQLQASRVSKSLTLANIRHGMSCSYQLEITLLHMVDDAAWRAHHYVYPALQNARLRPDGCSAIHSQRLQVRSNAVKFALNLTEQRVMDPTSALETGE